MGGHTPGPWSFDGPASSRIVWAGQDLRVCFLASDGPNLANARLIAAAPELLSVLRDLFENPQFQVAIGGNPNMVGALMDSARAAIAKATGAA